MYGLTMANVARLASLGAVFLLVNEIYPCVQHIALFCLIFGGFDH